MNDKEKIKILEEALIFYADPDNYFAIGFFPDTPCGDFINDFSNTPQWEYDRPMPGKLARETIVKINKK